MRDGTLYVCSSTTTLRAATACTEVPGTGAIGLDGLPRPVVEGLRARGLVFDAGCGAALSNHPLYPDSVGSAGRVVLACSDGPLADGICGTLNQTGAPVVADASPDQAAAGDVVVLPLSTQHQTLMRWAEAAVNQRLKLVVFVNSPTRLLLARLAPPMTACPVCLLLRIRSNHTWQAIADLPLQVLLGAADDARWPTTAIAAAIVAHQAVLALGGTAGDTADLIEIDYACFERTLHPVVHTPHCPACSADAILPQVLTPDQENPSDTWQRLRRAVSPLTGIVSDVAVTDGSATGIVNDSNDARAVVATRAVTRGGNAHTTWFNAVQTFNAGAAVKFDPVTARVCAVAEALERYSMGIYEPRDLLRAPYTAVTGAAVDPRSLVLGSVAEYARVARYVPFDPDAEIEWVQGHCLTTGAPRLVPACAVYAPYQPPSGERLWFTPTSNGVAAGSSYSHAALGGLYELIERDAFIVFWENKLTMPTLDIGSMGDSPEDAPTIRMLVELTTQGVEVSCKNVTTDLAIPAVAVRLLWHTTNGPRVVHASRANLDIRAAVRGALEEACWCKSAVPAALEEGGVPAADAILNSPEDFAAYYCAADRLAMLAFWNTGTVHPVTAAPPMPTSHDAELNEVVGRLADAGHDPIAVDITPIDVAEHGVRVVRTIAPGLCPLTLRSDFRRRGGARVYQAPVRMGVRAQPLSESELNPHPLPLP